VKHETVAVYGTKLDVVQFNGDKWHVRNWATNITHLVRPR